MKRCSTSFTIRETQIKATSRCHCSPIRSAKSPSITLKQGDTRQSRSWVPLLRMKTGACLEGNLTISSNATHGYVFNSAIFLLGLYPENTPPELKTHMHKILCSTILTYNIQQTLNAYSKESAQGNSTSCQKE